MARRRDASEKMKVTVKLNTQLYRRLQHYAIDVNKTASELVEEAIEALLSRKAAKS
jgi:predicted transcriptional regulator